MTDSSDSASFFCLARATYADDSDISRVESYSLEMMPQLDLSLALWQKITVLTLALSMLGFVLAVLFQVRLTDVLFIEGGLIFAFGAYVAAGPKTVDKRTTIVYPRVAREYLEEQRPRQVSMGVILMIIGAVLIVLGVFVGLPMVSPRFIAV